MPTTQWIHSSFAAKFNWNYISPLPSKYKPLISHRLVKLQLMTCETLKWLTEETCYCLLILWVMLSLTCDCYCQKSTCLNKILCNTSRNLFTSHGSCDVAVTWQANGHIAQHWHIAAPVIICYQCHLLAVRDVRFTCLWVMCQCHMPASSKCPWHYKTSASYFEYKFNKPKLSEGPVLTWCNTKWLTFS